jgi:hypothetical protein
MAMHFNRYYCSGSQDLFGGAACHEKLTSLVGWVMNQGIMMIHEATLVLADYDIGYKLTRSGNRFNQRIFHEMGYRFILMLQVFPFGHQISMQIFMISGGR